MKKLNVGVIGSGAISDIYLQNMIHRFPSLDVQAVASAHPENARKKAEKYGLRTMTVEEMLQDPQIEMVVILTPVGTHYQLIRRSLEHGKHVYTEKTMTDAPEKARELIRIADERNLYLGSAPDTFLGAALQTARKAVDDGLLGDIHSFAISSTRCNDLLLSMFSFLREPGCGIAYDYAVYYLTALVSLLGPVDQVASMISAPYPEHTGIIPERPDYGKTFATPNESQIDAIIRMKSGVTGTLHLDADSLTGDEAFFSIYGRKGVLRLTDPNQFGGEVLFIPVQWDRFGTSGGRVLEPVSELSDNCRGIGPEEMAEAIIEGRPNRTSKEMAYHVLETLTAILESGKNGAFRKVDSDCERPQPFQYRAET